MYPTSPPFGVDGEGGLLDIHFLVRESCRSTEFGRWRAVSWSRRCIRRLLLCCIDDWPEKTSVPQVGLSRIHENIIRPSKRPDASDGASFVPGFRDGVYDQNSLVD